MARKSSSAIDELIGNLDHPLVPDIQALRALILGISPAIGEEIKWNSPSFHTSEHFATMRLNGKPPLQLILHLGAKKQSIPVGAIEDPHAILKWLGPDRAVVNLPTAESFAQARKPLVAVIRPWLQHVPPVDAG
ncbi:MAG: DUF1801 domain-containing protein [Dokdonella sp.]|uniref:DUF1801 domain-containing protein n=1 Tax=Dokdonella sp. TaxID=2291710 RepID=UPI0032656121